MNRDIIYGGGWLGLRDTRCRRGGDGGWLCCDGGMSLKYVLGLEGIGDGETWRVVRRCQVMKRS